MPKNNFDILTNNHKFAAAVLAGSLLLTSACDAKEAGSSTSEPASKSSAAVADQKKVEFHEPYTDTEGDLSGTMRIAPDGSADLFLHNDTTYNNFAIDNFEFRNLHCFQSGEVGESDDAGLGYYEVLWNKNGGPQDEMSATYFELSDSYVQDEGICRDGELNINPSLSTRAGEIAMDITMTDGSKVARPFDITTNPELGPLPSSPLSNQHQ